jgi:hypothetical protein
MSDISNIIARIGLPNHMKILLVEKANPDNILDEFTVLVNPESYIVNYTNNYFNDQEQGAKEPNYTFNKVHGQTMSITLLFDSTGSLGNIPFISQHSVLDQIERFLEVIQYKTGAFERGVGNSLKLIWGPMQFLGILSNLTISYSHFDRQGTPIRATATCTFCGGDVSFKMSKKAKRRHKKGKDLKKINIGKQKHAINAVVKYGHYAAIVYRQPEALVPSTLRSAQELARMIF